MLLKWHYLNQNTPNLGKYIADYFKCLFQSSLETDGCLHLRGDKNPLQTQRLVPEGGGAVPGVTTTYDPAS